MKEIVIKFIYNEIEYIVYKGEDKYIPCKIENNNISFDLTNEELSIINSVFNKVKVTDNKIKLSNIEYNSKLYQHFYDKTNNWNIFLNIDGTDITKEELSTFNNLFNYQDSKMYMASNVDNKKDSFIKRLVKFGKKIIVILVLSTTLISPLTTLTTVQGKEIKNEVVEKQETKEELSAYQKIENLKKTINDNKNLSDEEKNFALKIYDDILYDNIDYIDYEEVKELFKDFDIIYEENENDRKKTLGNYDLEKNSITLYNVKNIKDISKNVLIHEFFHILQGKQNFEDSLMYEPITDILVNEYEGIKENKNYRSFSNGYNWIKPYMYALFEIIGSEPFRYYYFTGDTSKIKEELMNIIDDESKATSLIKLSGLKMALTRGKSMKRTADTINEYYKAKYGKSMFENKEILISFLSLNENGIAEVLNPKLVSEDIKFEIENQKMYFNRKYIDKNKDTKCVISTSNFINEKIESSINDYISTIKNMKKDGIISNKLYKKLKNKYKLYLNKVISFKKFKKYASKYDIDILDEETLKTVSKYSTSNSKNNEIELTENLLLGKENEIKDVIYYNIDIDQVLFNDNTYINGINLKSYNDDKLRIKIEDKYDDGIILETPYANEIINYINTNLVNKKYGKSYEDFTYNLDGDVLIVEGTNNIYKINILTGEQVLEKQKVLK